MGSLSRSSIVIPVCFTDLLAAHTVPYVATTPNDLITTALGLSSVLDCVIIVFLFMFVFSMILLCIHVFGFCWVYIKRIMDPEENNLESNDQDPRLHYANSLHPHISGVCRWPNYVPFISNQYKSDYLWEFQIPIWSTSQPIQQKSGAKLQGDILHQRFSI